MSDVDARICLVGDELLAGELADANGPWFAERLTEAGFRVTGMSVLPDGKGAIRDAVSDAARAARLVLVAGGLGPTSDDLTTAAVADALGVPLQLDEWLPSPLGAPSNLPAGSQLAFASLLPVCGR